MSVVEDAEVGQPASSKNHTVFYSEIKVKGADFSRRTDRYRQGDGGRSARPVDKSSESRK